MSVGRGIATVSADRDAAVGASVVEGDDGESMKDMVRGRGGINTGFFVVASFSSIQFGDCLLAFLLHSGRKKRSHVAEFPSLQGIH